MTTSIRKGTCEVAELDARHLSQLLSEVSSFVAMLEGRGHGKYLVSHIEHHVDAPDACIACEPDEELIDWYTCSIFYDYFFDKWEDLDLNNETEEIDAKDELIAEGSIDQ